eukprot:scaffold207521_cov18-Tisochrysis_lutea.AAC.1
MAAAAEVVTSEAATAGLQTPHGGKLVNLQAPQSEWPALIQVRRSLCVPAIYIPVVSPPCFSTISS